MPPTATAASLYSIECSDQPLDVSFHPERDTIVAAALVDGTIEVHDFQTLITDKKDNDGGDDDDSDDDETILSSTDAHKQLIPNTAKPSGDKNAFKKASCRAIQFSNNNGHRIYTGGSAGDLCCLDSNIVCHFRSPSNKRKEIVWRVDSASAGNTATTSTTPTNPLHVLHQLPVSCSKGALIVSGDDRGGVRLWDERLCDVATAPDQKQSSKSSGPLQLPQGCVLSWKEQKDFISALDHSEDGNTLLATSADGCLAVFDIRQASAARSLQDPNLARKSDPQDDELLSLATLKNGKKVVAGTQDGVLAIWSWGTWGDISDRYPLLQNNHSSLDAIVKVDEDTLLTGSSDGLIRVVTLHPNKILGALGDHGGFPIEGLAFNANRKFVGSISHDPYIRLWDTTMLDEDDDDDDEDEDNAEMDEDEGGVAKKSSTRKQLSTATRAAGQASDDEWEEMDEEDEDDDEDKDDEKDSDDSDDDSDSDDDEPGPSKSDSRAKKLKTNNDDFFADL